MIIIIIIKIIIIIIIKIIIIKSKDWNKLISHTKMSL